ncbi:hypothetical protein [Rhodococcus jostii]|uniref:Uncharacterized protein n=1 Tax=Rhodococcus jostii TaxID=132919 RepID=A0ABU4CUJ0_RHOJO|nr:hypothetical protein [Rhodococcus jostii]MDV6286913.1 hypothetical protein [Rhodococcus jostii]
MTTETEISRTSVIHVLAHGVGAVHGHLLGSDAVFGGAAPFGSGLPVATGHRAATQSNRYPAKVDNTP